MKSIKISACVICRDEENNIDDWLHNVRNFADEIIVVDTGSMDRTQEICKKFGVECYQYEWNDDFATVKNYAISKVTGEWIVFTDTDELFYNPVRVRESLMRLILNNDNIDAIMVPISNVDIDFNDMEIYRFNAIRIFRNVSYLRYFGRIHEVLSNVNTPGDSGSLKIIIANNNLLVRHTGYSSSIIKKKIQRNIYILNKEIENIGLQDRHYYYLADSFYAIGDYVEALKYAMLAIESTMQSIEQKSNMLWIVADCLGELKYNFEDRKSFLEAAIRDFPDIPDFFALMGILLKHNEYYDDAILYLEDALAKADTRKSTYMNSIKSNVHTVLGQCYWIVGKYDAAEKNIIIALNINKWNDTALLALAELYGNKHTDTLHQILYDLYGNDNNEYRLIQQIFADNGIVSLSGDFFLEEQKMLFEGRYMDLYNISLRKDAEYIQYLFISMLGKDFDNTSEMEKNQLSMLPGDLSDIVHMYHNDLQENMDYTDLQPLYKSMLSAVLSFSDDEIIVRYSNLAILFGVDVVIFTAEQLRNAEMWREALSIYEQVPETSTDSDELFWLGSGICFYQLKKYEMAQECLSKALEICKEKKDDVNKVYNEAYSYLSWCREVLA